LCAEIELSVKHFSSFYKPRRPRNRTKSADCDRERCSWKNFYWLVHVSPNSQIVNTLLNAAKITGVTGFVGFRVLATALQKGYRVRAAIRRKEQEHIIRAAHSIQPYHDKLTFIVVPDMRREGAYDQSLQGVTYVVHVAFPCIQGVCICTHQVVSPR
jgi:hypothetical protein